MRDPHIIGLYDEEIWAKARVSDSVPAEVTEEPESTPEPGESKQEKPKRKNRTAKS